MRILDAEQMRRVDQAAIEELGVPSLVLMENAALGVVELIGERYPEVRSVAIFCGPGNNGGDGLAVGRQLAVRGYAPHLFLWPGKGGELAGDAALQLAICRRMELPLWPLREEDEGGEAELAAVIEAARASDLVVDALFGTGLSRPLTGYLAELVLALNRLDLPRVAVDLPSGLAGGEAAIPGPCIHAHHTVTFAAPKVAHVFPPAAEAVGEWVVADLGVPAELVERAEGERLDLLTAEEVAALLPPARRPSSHKGSFGHVLIVAGGPGGAGAAVLAARAAGRMGAGLVTVATPASLRATVDAGCIEAMVLPLPERAPGYLAGAAAAVIREASQGKSVLALGPGLGTDRPPGGSDGLEATLRAIALESPLPLVLDADGLNAFAGRLAELAGRRPPTLLTPHPGEMGRLLGWTTAEVEKDRRGAAVRAARESGATVLLKGRLTLIATPAGELWVNPTGNPGMATGGSGDVLTGMIAALEAQGLEARPAACAAAYLHGLAGDLAADELGEISIVAGDLIEALPEALRRLGGE